MRQRHTVRGIVFEQLRPVVARIDLELFQREAWITCRTTSEPADGSPQTRTPPRTQPRSPLMPPSAPAEDQEATVPP